MRIEGVIPPMITPFKEDGSIDFNAHQHNVEKWNGGGLAGYLVMGSNSEAVYLTEKEKLQLIEATVEAATDKHLVIAGTGMESTRETIRLTNLAAERGAKAALIVTPFYYGPQMDSTALIRHYEEVAGASEIPVMIYNVPKYTHLNVSAALVERLSRHPNIIGMKDSTGNIAQLVQFQAAAAGEKIRENPFQVLVGSASVWYPALVLGCEAGIMALANCAPAECSEVQRLFSEDRWEEAEYLYRQLVPVNQAVTATYGIAGLKYACSLRGYQSGTVRRPLRELNAGDRAEIQRILEKADLL